MKRWMKVVMGVVIGIVVLLVGLTLFGGYAVKGAVNTAGPKLLGVPVSVQHVSLGLFTGRFQLNDLVIGNPDGFKTPEAIRVKRVALGMKMSSLFSKVLVIESIRVEGPEITYEVGLKGSNIGALQEKTAPAKPAEKPAPATEPAAAGERKVVIDDLRIEDGKVHLSTIGMAGHRVSLPLPTIHLTGLGRESNGASLSDVMNKVLGAIGSAASSVATGAGKSVEAVGEGAKAAGKAVGAAAGKAVESVGGLFKK